jgi:hypothetical protein
VKVILTELKSKKSYPREQNLTVSQTDKHFDVFRVNFGMSKNDVKANELDRHRAPTSGPGGWTETSPTAAYIYDSKLGMDLFGYEFSADKLVAVNTIKYHSTEVDTEYFSSYDRDEMIQLAKSKGIKIPTFQSKVVSGQVKYRTEDKVTWVQNGIKFTFGLRNLLILKNAANYYALTYEKAN